MLLSGKIASISDEFFWNMDSFSSTSTLFKLNSYSYSRGKLSATDFADYYYINLPAGSYRLYVTTDGMGNAVQVFNSAFSISIIDSAGRTVLYEDLSKPDIYTDAISFTYNGTGEYWLKIQTASSYSYNYAVAVYNTSPPPSNNTPILAKPISDQTFPEDTPWSFTVPAGTFSDPDGDVLYYSASLSDGSALPLWLQFNAITLTFSGTPPKDANGYIDVTIKASDGALATFDTFRVLVSPVNDAPAFSAASQAISATAGTAKTIGLSATDVDGDALTYTTATPGKGAASISGSTLTYTPGAGAWGTDSFVVTAADSKGGTATQTINVTVLAAAATKAFTVTTLPGWVGAIGGNGSVVGSNGFEDITVLFGQIALDGSFNRGGDIVRVSGNADSYLIGRTSASNAYIETETSKVAIPIGSTGMGIVFGDGVRKLSFTSGAYRIGSQTFTADPSKITSTSDGTALPTGADPAAQAIVTMLSAGLSGGKAPDLTITGKARIVGTNGVDVIKVGNTGGDLVFDGSFNRGGDIIVLNKAAGDYSAAKFNASTIVITSGIEKLTIPMGTTGMTLRFTDGDRTLVFKNGAFYIGEQAFTATTATQIVSSSNASLDAGTSLSFIELSAAGSNVVFYDDATQGSYVKIKNFTSGDLIKVTSASEKNYSFSSLDLDDDGAADDLQITFSNPETGVVNDIQILSVVSPSAYVFDKNSAISAVGFNFISFG